MRTKDSQLHTERRLQVLRAAEVCFAKDGFHKTSMRSICKKANMSPGSVYQFYSSKEDIIEAFCHHEVDWVIAKIEHIKKKHSFKKAFLQVVITYIKETNDRTNARITFDIITEAVNNKKIQSILEYNNQQLQHALADLFSWAKCKKKIESRLHSGDLSQIWIAIIDGYTGRVIVEPELHFAKIKKLLDNVFDTLVSEYKGV